MTLTAHELRVKDEVQQLRALVDSELPRLVQERHPAGLYEPVRYVLESGGKRLRPVLLLVTARVFDVAVEDALPAALAVEVFHNFTLVHDDIMDHADERRGRQTVHVRWDESTAILCGDYLMGLSYALIARSGSERTADLIEHFQSMVARLCEGQTMDKEFESRRDVSVDEYLHMVDCKTGALLRSCLVLGGMLGGASEGDLRTLGEVGTGVGRAFQIKDDLLDLTAVDDQWGKTIGGDLIEGKKTYLLLRAIERTEGSDRDWFLRIVNEGGLPEDEVPEARERMQRSGVLEEARSEVLRYSRNALDAVERLPHSPSLETLTWLLLRMQERLH